ncbi:MAG: hypothetical protein ACP5N9_02675 [Candidatus Bilamarchaeum sp.]|jgi:predicted nucleic acid-binding Zn ribbon protein
MKVCVVCEAALEGKKAYPIKEDNIIRAFRKIKKAFNVAKMNELYVCEDDFKKHQQRRKSFENGLLLSSVLAGLLFVVVLGLSLFSGRFDLWSLFSAIVISIFIICLPLFKYVPAVEDKAVLV